MEKLDTYLNLCTQVYDLSKPTAPQDAYEFYHSYAAEVKGPILEPMCGTGRFLIPLLEEGFDIHGFDASEYMLTALHAKVSDNNIKSQFKNRVWQGFVEELKRPEKYKLIFIPAGSFCLIINPETIKTALKIFYNHLTDDGVLLFEGETIKAVPQTDIWRGSVWPKPDGQMIMLSSLAIFEDNVCRSIGKYELVHHNKIIHTEVEELKVRVYEPKELINILDECGFKNIKVIKAYDRNKSPDENDEAIVYECRK
jgi:SAM-dependent methyltransferase